MVTPLRTVVSTVSAIRRRALTQLCFAAELRCRVWIPGFETQLHLRPEIPRQAAFLMPPSTLSAMVTVVNNRFREGEKRNTVKSADPDWPEKL